MSEVPLDPTPDPDADQNSIQISGTRRLVVVLGFGVLTHIVMIYIWDCSLLRLALTCLFHSELTYLPLKRAGRRVILICFVTNQCVAVFSHACTRLITPDIDGFVHGKIPTDFIGVSPSPRLQLIFSDLCVLFLEFLVFCIVCDPRYRRQQLTQLDERPSILVPSELQAECLTPSKVSIDLCSAFKRDWLDQDMDESTNANSENILDRISTFLREHRRS